MGKMLEIYHADCTSVLLGTWVGSWQCRRANVQATLHTHRHDMSQL